MTLHAYFSSDSHSNPSTNRRSTIQAVFYTCRRNYNYVGGKSGNFAHFRATYRRVTRSPHGDLDGSSHHVSFSQVQIIQNIMYIKKQTKEKNSPWPTKLNLDARPRDHKIGPIGLGYRSVFLHSNSQNITHFASLCRVLPGCIFVSISAKFVSPGSYEILATSAATNCRTKW